MDLASLPGLWSLTPIGALLLVLVIFFWLMATGKIITVSSHLRELAMERQRSDEWKQTANSKDSVNNELLKQNGILISSGRTLTSNTPVEEKSGGGTLV
jgi:hypothetical protein